MRTLLDVTAILLGVLALAFLVASVWTIRRKSLLKTGLNLSIGVLLFSVAALLGTLAIATRGYRALTREEVVAMISTEPIAPQRFRVHFQFPDGKRADFELAGDALYVDAHILKWKPIANLVGLHTSYELDRVTGRYTKIHDEQVKPRTVYSLAGEKPVGLFELRKNYRLLEPLVDAQYGSATFGPISEPAQFELRVSTTGLLLRPAALGSRGG